MAFHYLRSDRGQRSNWRFQYFAKEISDRARTKAIALLKEERSIEQALAACLNGEAYHGRDEDLIRIQKRLREKGEEREECELLARELARAGEQIVSLEIGDLVYFNMDEQISDPMTTTSQMPKIIVDDD